MLLKKNRGRQGWHAGSHPEEHPGGDRRSPSSGQAALGAHRLDGAPRGRPRVGACRGAGVNRKPWLPSGVPSSALVVSSLREKRVRPQPGSPAPRSPRNPQASGRQGLGHARSGADFAKGSQALTYDGGSGVLTNGQRPPRGAGGRGARCGGAWHTALGGVAHGTGEGGGWDWLRSGDS